MFSGFLSRDSIFRKVAQNGSAFRIYYTNDRKSKEIGYKYVYNLAKRFNRSYFFMILLTRIIKQQEKQTITLGHGHYC